jgi:hypothetical protein
MGPGFRQGDNRGWEFDVPRTQRTKHLRWAWGPSLVAATTEGKLTPRPDSGQSSFSVSSVSLR